MSGPVSPPTTPEPIDRRLYWRVGWFVLAPAVFAVLAASFARTAIGSLVAIALATVFAAISTHWIVAPVAKTVTRLRKTAGDLKAVLPQVDPSFVIAPAENQNELEATEEGLFATAVRVRAELESLRDQTRQLQQSTTLFAGVLETMQEAVLVVDSGERVLFINSAARDLFEASPSAGSGKLAWEGIRSSGLQEVVEQALSTGRTVRGEVELPRQKRLVEVSAVVLSLADGPGCLAVAYDVTDLRRLEKMRREFVSNVSHELKTPLTSIQAYADTLLNGGLEDEGSSRLFVERIVEQSERLSMLIQDLLRLAKIESEPEAFLIEPCDAVAIASTVFQDLQNVAQTRQIDLQYVPRESPLDDLADADGLRTILNNLLTNAINYTQSGGKVQLSLTPDGERALFCVSDTGVGIAKEHQSRVFERFYRVLGTQQTGCGLGLTIVQEIAERHQATVSIFSKGEGLGSLFTVRFAKPYETKPVVKID